MNSIEKIILITGLPGSGKTRLAEDLRVKHSAKVISLDDHKELPKFIIRREKTLVIEGLISGKAFFKLLDLILKKFESTKKWDSRKNKIPVTIISFSKDIESCMWNDRARGRDKNAFITIKNMKIVMPTKDSLAEKYRQFKFKMETRKVTKAKKVTKANPALVWAKENADLSEHAISTSKPGYYYNSNGNGLFFTSASWSLGGSCGNYYDGELTTIDPDPSPDSFDRLDQLLEKVCENISFIQYKVLCRECVEIIQTSDSDYYGGSTTYAQYVCDLNKLYKFLVDRKLIEEIS